VRPGLVSGAGLHADPAGRLALAANLGSEGDDTMRLSCCAYSYRQAFTSGAMTLPDFLRLCREIGFGGVELTAYYFPTTERDFLNEIKRQAHREGLAISGTAVGTDFAQPDAEKRRAHVALTQSWLEHSVALGAPTLRVFAGAAREGQSE